MLTELCRISDHTAIFKSLERVRLGHTLKTVVDSPLILVELTFGVY